MESILKKGTAQFNLIGEAKVNDFTFKTDEASKNSDWVYNTMRLGVDCGTSGDIYAEMMGGYGADRNNVLYVHGKKDKDGKMVDDWSNQYKIDWDDRFDEAILEEIGSNCFITVGVEKDVNGKVFSQKFLSEYDAIAYALEHLEDGMVVNVRGDIEYSVYLDNVQSKKKIKSLYLSHAEDREKYGAKFTQTILVDTDSLEKKDSDKNVYPISAYVVEYINKPLIDGEKIEVKMNLALQKGFELEIKDEVKTEKLAKKLFKPTSSKALYEVTVEGIITKGGAANVTLNLEDLPEDIQELIELGAFTAEEALEKCVGKQSSVETFLITNPQIRRIGEERTPVIAFDKEKYKYEDLVTYQQALSELLGTEKPSSKSDVNETTEDDGEFDMDALLDGLED